MERQTRIDAEAQALWRELYGEPAPSAACGAELLEIILGQLPEASYERLNSPHLRREDITWPRKPAPASRSRASKRLV
jgi:hypothetical protein